MKRKDVYNLIDGERRYQDSLGPNRMEPTPEPHSVGDYTTMMAHYQAQLIRDWTLNPGDTKALDVMRKMAGIAVHCMEDHGAPARAPKAPTRPHGAKQEATDPLLDDVEIGSYKLGKSSLKNLEGVHPDLVRIVHHAIGITAQDFTVTDGVRTREEQAEYVRTRVSQTMKSKHLIQSDGFSHAVDLVPWINGRARWELLACYKIMEAVRRASFACGGLLRWGGAWVPLYNETPLQAPEKLVQAYAERKRARDKPAFIDAPHYEMT
jgi:peptidoglycan L-alanyl-D-glutamate endopeptidase CwlK